MKKMFLISTLNLIVVVLMFSACGKIVLDENFVERGEEMEVAESGVLVICNVNAEGLGAHERQGVGTRGLSADGYELTEIWVFDCLEDGCKLLAKQTSEEESFGQVRFRLDFGEHKLAVVASRGEDADFSEENGRLVWGKVKDTFWNVKNLDVSGGSTMSFNLNLNRVAGKIKVDFLDVVPAELKKVNVYVAKWLTGIDVRTGEGVGSMTATTPTEEEMEITVPSQYVGTQQLSISLWGFSLDDGFSSDVDLVWRNGLSSIISERLCTNVPIWKNKVTRISGELMKGEASGTLSVNGSWGDQYDYNLQ